MSREPDQQETATQAAYALEDYLAYWWRGELCVPEAALGTWARRQRLRSLMSWRAETEGWELPSSLVDGDRRARLLIAARQLIVDHQLTSLGQLAKQLSVPLVLVKGAAAAQAYPEPWMRPYGDIDLLIPKADAQRFLEALRTLGYRQNEGSVSIRGWHFPPLRPSRTGLIVEVHTALAQERSRELFTVEQWARGLQSSSSYSGILVPHPVDHVLYLVHHAVIHHELQMGLQPYADIGLWTQSWSQSEWDALADRADETRLQPAIALALALTTWFWNRPLPDATRMSLPAVPPDLFAAAKEIAGGRVTPRQPKIWRDVPDRTLRGLLTYAKLVLLGDPAQLEDLTPAERRRFHLNRPSQLLRHHGESLWRLVTGDRDAREAWRTQRDLQTWLRGL